MHDQSSKFKVNELRIPDTVPQEHALCLHYLPHQATACVPLDLVNHLHLVAHLSLQAITDGVQDQNMQTIPSDEFQDQLLPESCHHAGPIHGEGGLSHRASRFAEEKMDPVIIDQQELEQG